MGICVERSVVAIPRPYVSVHLRYGSKPEENGFAITPERYMTALMKKYPHVRNIFISTETQDIIDFLQTRYQEYSFYQLNYTRTQNMALWTIDPTVDYVYEFIMSIANLYVSVEADGFIGTLTSNWCILMQSMEHTRGDGGSTYHSMDTGSAFSLCG